MIHKLWIIDLGKIEKKGKKIEKKGKKNWKKCRVQKVHKISKICRIF